MTPHLTSDLLATAPLATLAERLGGAPHTARLTYAGETLDVATNVPAVLTWARRYLEPIVTVAEGAATTTAYWSFIVPDTTGFAAAVAAEAGTPLPVHLRRTATVHPLGAGRLAVVDPDGPSVYLVDRESRSVLNVTTERANDIRDLARQARELLLTAMLARGYITLHAAAVAHDGEAVLFAGNKGAGKTTLSLKQLEAPRAEYLGNDRVLVGPGPDGGLDVLPYAMSARIGGGTLQHHPVLRSHLHAFDHFHAAILPLEDQFIHQDKLELSPGELTRILGVPFCPTARLQAVVWPSLQTGKAGGGPAETSVPTEDKICAYLEEVALVPDPDGSGWLRELLGGINHRTEEMVRTIRQTAAAPQLAVTGTADAMSDLVTRRYWPDAPPSPDPRTWARPVLDADLVCVMHHVREDRGLTLARWNTRAVAAGQVHELLVCDADELATGSADHVRYLGFARFDAGILAVGDELRVGDETIGVLAGFDDAHLPDHMNVVFTSPVLKTGAERGLAPGDTVRIVPPTGA
ncbi:DUF6917 domain-containing protein [Actinomadura macrotermitis]|uniref:DUF6917 domain-containing protein n=1 Tax=Actinomadura macrotermitis TaxID=2585200 RepID=A0A7K0BV41_9ACTN|nr:hypothetical protein [Actinomadura macrotermitis]MQY05031.1 hypothetical protein [Actinomadura macrotermitis]